MDLTLFDYVGYYLEAYIHVCGSGPRAMSKADTLFIASHDLFLPCT
jgi:hypothetical protein